MTVSSPLVLLALISKGVDAALIIAGMVVLLAAGFWFIWIQTRKRYARMKMEAVALAKALGFSLKGPSGIFFASVEGSIDGIAVSVALLRKGGVWLKARSPRIPADFQVSRAQWKQLFDAPASSGPLRALPVEVVKELHWMYSRLRLFIDRGTITHVTYIYPDPTDRVRRFAGIAKAIERAVSGNQA